MTREKLEFMAYENEETVFETTLGLLMDDYKGKDKSAYLDYLFSLTEEEIVEELLRSNVPSYTDTYNF